MDLPARPLTVAQAEKVGALKAHKQGQLKRLFAVMNANAEVDA